MGAVALFIIAGFVVYKLIGLIYDFEVGLVKS